MNRIFYILVICCQAFGVSAQSVADAGLFTYSAAGTVTASLSLSPVRNHVPGPHPGCFCCVQEFGTGGPG